MLDIVDVDAGDAERLMADSRWTDGLPVRLPIADVVDAFIEAAGLDRTTVLGAVPPANGLATVENVAVNALMAGCRPEHLAVVVGAVSALLKEPFDLYDVQCTTNPVTPLTVVNGPARSRGMESGRGALGPGQHANGVIGRAIRFVLGNIGGSFDPGIDMANHGWSPKYTCCLAEAEEQSPWEPLHAWLGYDSDQSVATTIPIESLIDVVPSYGNTQADHLIDHFGRAMRTMGTCYFWSQGNPLLIVNPTHAAILANAGIDRSELQRLLFAEAQIPVASMPFGNIPVGDWRLVDDKVLGMEQPEDIYIVVAGAEGGHHTLYGMGFALSKATSAPIPDDRTAKGRS